MPSVYAKCGRFEGVAYYGPCGYIFTANYAHSLKEAFALVKQRHPRAKVIEVVEYEADGLSSKVVVRIKGGTIWGGAAQVECPRLA